MEALTPRTLFSHPVVRMGGGMGPLAVLCWALLIPTATWAAGAATGSTNVSTLFDRIADDPVRLRMFLLAMPKGGDLHNHLDGAVYAESYLD